MFGLFKRTPDEGKAPPAAAALRKVQLQPRIKHLNFLRALQQGGVPSDQLPPTAALCGELIVTYAFDLPDSLMMATPSLLAQAGVSNAELPQLALDNLKRVLPQPQFFAKDGCGVAFTGEGLEATLLLVDSVWDGMQANFRGEILATVPRRDRILMCDSADAAAVAALREQSAEFFDEINDAHRLSTQLMVRHNGSWSLFDNH